MRRTSLVLGFILAGIVGSTRAAPPEGSTSQLISEGIGRRYAPSGGPLAFSAWPLPLQRVTRATMASTISPDGQLVVIGAGHPHSAGDLTVWDVESRKPIWNKPFHRGIRRVQFVPDTELIVVAGFDGKARLMEARTGRQIREFTRHTDGINGIAISTDASRLATGGHDDQVMLWNLQTGQHLRTFRGHQDDVLTVAFVPTEPLLISSGRDRRLLIWNIETGELVHELTGPEDLVEDVVLSPSGKVIAAASGDGKTWLWNRETGELLGTLPAQRGRLVSATFTPQGDFLAMAGFDGEVSIWDHAQRAVVARVTAHSSAVFGVTFQQDGSQFLSHGWSGDGKLWKSDGTLVAEFPAPSAAEMTVISAAWAPDESSVAVLNQAGAIRLVDVNRRQEIGIFSLADSPATSIAFLEAGLISAHADGTLRKVSRDGAFSEPVIRSTGGFAELRAAGPDSVAVRLQDGKAGVLDLTSGKLTMLGDFADVTQVAASPGLNWCATLHQPGHIRFWDPKTGRKLTGELNPDGESTRSIAVSAAGSRMLCAVAAGTVRYRVDRVDDDMIFESAPLMPVANGPLRGLEISPDGRTAVGGLDDGTIRVLGTEGLTGAAFKKDNEAGTAIRFAFGPKTQRLISVTANGQGWLWDIDAANTELLPLASMPAHEKGARFVGFALNDTSLVSEGFDNKAWVWDLKTGERRQLKGSCSTCAITPDSLKMALGQFPGRLDLRDISTLEVEREFAGVPRGAYSLSFSPDQTRLLATFYEKDLVVYDISSPAPLFSLGPAPLPWTYAAFSPDGLTFVSCTGDWKQQNSPGSVRLHDAATGKIVVSYQGQMGEVKYAAFDRDGKRLVVTSSDKTVRIFNVADGNELAVLKQPDTAFCAQFVPDSDLLITGDYRGFLRVWDLRTNTLGQTLRAHADWIQRLVFSRDMSTLATAGRDGSVKLWKVTGTGNLLGISGNH